MATSAEKASFLHGGMSSIENTSESPETFAVFSEVEFGYT